MIFQRVFGLLFALLSAASAAIAQAPAKPFLTGNCVKSDSLQDFGDLVERPEQAAALRPGNRLLRFPDEIRREGYVGEVVAAFIVDANMPFTYKGPPAPKTKP